MCEKIILKKIPNKVFIAILICTITFMLGIALNIRFLLMIGLFGTFFYSIFYLRKESYLAVAFLISFFTFLLGRIFINAISGEKSLLIGAFIYDSGPTDKELIETLALLFISMVCFLFTVLSVPKSRGKNKIKKIKKKNIEIACISVFYLTIAFELIVSIERFIFLIVGGSYTAYYTSFSRTLPSFFYKIAELNTPAFFALLASSPSKNKTKPIIFLYLLNSLIILLAGQRNLFVRAVLITFCYILLRNKWDSEEQWLSKKQLRMLLYSIPLFIIALQAWGTVRNGSSFNITGISETIKDFFRDQGTTSVVVYKGIDLKNNFPSEINYTFAPIINFLKNNQIIKTLFHTTSYAQQTTELALKGNNFGSTLTYLYVPYYYKIGIGMGSCYISEVFHDYGIIGVCLINILYGIVLVKLENYFSQPTKSVFVGMILFLFADGIIYSPRNSAFSFLTNGINFTVFLFIFLIYFISSLLKERNLCE